MAGVSGTTVSLAFKPGKTRVSDATKRRVMEVARQLNYVPNLTARNLRTGPQPTIGFLVADITNPFYSRMVQVVEDTARGFGFTVSVAESRWDADTENTALSNMIQNRVQGVLATFCEKTTEGMAMMDQQGVPHIAVDTCPPGYNGSYLLCDMEQAGRLACDHLLAQGYAAPVLMMPVAKGKMFSAFERLMAGVRQSLSAADCSINIAARLVDSELSVEGGRRAFAGVRQMFPDADCVICASDLCAFGVLDQLHAKGIKPGLEFGVIGIDDLDVSGMNQISLTSVREPYERLATTAATSLIKAIQAGKPVNVRAELDVEIVCRGSTQHST